MVFNIKPRNNNEELIDIPEAGSSSVSSLSMMVFESVPSEWQIPLVALAAILGVLVIVGLTMLNKSPSKSAEQQEDEELHEETTTPEPFSPVKKMRSPKGLGSIATPSGRRSARIAGRPKSRKED
mmetsp:Transcript_7209/g.10313  ORF Transcript_7209/g.10313 Transcript_7209/m.10313 type:complete len:125 (+) Transcript_7209:61-435(+)